MADLLHRIERAKRPPLHYLTPAVARSAYAAGADMLEMPRAALPRVEDLQVPTRDGQRIAARLYAALARDADGAATPPVALYFHGGGFVLGGIETHDALCRELALQSGGAIVSLGYRLAPEHRFPVAYEDAWDALLWLRQQGPALGVNAACLCVAGDSAGGALAAAVALTARDEGIALAGQLLITPHAAADPTPSRAAYASGFLLDATTIEWFFGHAIDDDRRDDWRFAPLHADHLDGVAPASVLLAECDPLLDEGLAYADRLRAAGVPVSLELVRGVTHEFIKFPRVLPEAVAARRWAADALREAWSCQP